eukprot:c17904_g1_i1.p1 GENE.c17904_g1_i1~~c17904_g1_i1.p1  ORF type:complete len:140 (+),score=40.37 c17904_g1_i1:3-422(+)
MWSVGVVVYILLCGFPPFHGKNEVELFQRVLNGRLKFPKPYWDIVGDQAKDLVGHLLEKDPEKRYTAQEALEHPWFADIVGDVSEERLRIDTSLVDMTGNGLGSALDLLRLYNAFRKFRKGVIAVIAMNKFRAMDETDK